MHAGTNANVFATIYGENGEWVTLEKESYRNLGNIWTGLNEIRLELRYKSLRLESQIVRIIRRDDLNLTEINLTGPL